MEADNEILFLGIVVGWIMTILILTFVGIVEGVNQFILITMMGFSGGVLFGVFLIIRLVYFFKEFKVVRRD